MIASPGPLGAPAPAVRAALLVPLLLLLAAACAERTSSVSGDLLEADAATDVWVLGTDARAAVADGAFELDGLRGDTLHLRFSRGEDEVARMDVVGLPDGARLRLERVWIEEGVALPSAVEVEGAEVVAIEGLRWGGAVLLDGDLDERATVLAVGDDGDALLARPLRDDLPDLRVVVTPGTLVRGEDGDPAEVDDLSFGDTLAVVGMGEGGFLVATELVLPRRGSPPDR